MNGFAKAALEDCADRIDATGRDYLERIVAASARMQQLIHDVLTYSIVARSQIKLHPVCLDKLIAEIVQQYPEMQPPNAEVTIRSPLTPVLAHEPSLTQAISNLLSNGVKFVPRGTMPRVQVWTEQLGCSVRLWFQDNGIGIKPAYQARVFGMFERAHDNPEYEGAGIGLAIVRKATERMGGKVGVQSDGILGTSFWIELPASTAQ
jgi:signal transduction histidine kinase